MGLLALSRPAPAAAATVPPTVSEHLSDVERFVVNNGVTTDALPSCTNVCSDLWLEEHRPIGGQPTSSELWGELNELGGEAKTMPRMIGVLGDVALAAGTFALGVSIGQGVNAKWLHLGLPTPIAPGTLGPDGNPWGRLWLDTDTFHLVPHAPDNGPDGTLDSYWPAGQSGEHVDRDVLTVVDQTRKNAGAFPSAWQQTTGSAANDATAPNCYEQLLPIAHTHDHLQVVPDRCSHYEPSTQALTYYNGADVAQYVLPSEVATEKAKPLEVGDPIDRAVTTWPGQPDAATAMGNVGTAIAAHPDRYGPLLAWIESTIEEPASMIDVPDCRGMLLADCLSALETAGFTGAHHTVTLTPEDAHISRPPATIVKTTPAPGTRIADDSEVTIERNPGPATMPTIVPTIAPGATPAEVERALEDARLTPHIVTAPTPDPLEGPYVVTHTPTDPRRGARVDPNTDVTVEVNPADAPDPGPTSTGGGGSDTEPFAPPDLPAINLAPLSQAINCNVFPFGVPCWVAGALGGFSGDGHAPAFDIPLPYDKTLHVDLAIIGPELAVFRPVMLLCSFIALAWLFMSAAMGFGGSGGEGSES